MRRLSDSDFPVLQVAIDEMLLHRALEMAEAAVRGGADWVEVGTPLIKSEGMNAVRVFRERFPDRVLVADTKTMDTGGYEVEMAAKAGADVVAVLGVADDETILEGVESGRNYGAEVMVDLLGHPDPVKRAREVESLGVGYVCVHVGIDQQMRGVDPLEVLEKVVDAVASVRVAVAGGIDSVLAPEVVSRGADVVIVGGAITKALDIARAAEEIKKAMKGARAGGKRKRYRAEEIRDAFLEATTCNISDALHRRGAMEGIRPVYDGVKKMVGVAVTVETVDGDWAKPVEAIDMAGPGDVLVIAARPGKKAVWGELATNSVLQRGIEGVVVDGAVRDVDNIKKLGVPVFAACVRPNAGEPRGIGKIGGTIECGGQRVRPGDWIIGDGSGVVVVPRERALEIANRAVEVREKEDRIREEIKKGKKTLGEVLDLLRWEQVG